MKSRFFYIIFFIAMQLTFYSCTKNPEKIRTFSVDETLEKNCNINGVNTIGITFVSRKFDGNKDSVYVYFTNKSMYPIDSVIVLIELCTYPESFENCKSVYSIKLGHFNQHDTIGYQFLYSTTHFQLANKVINVGIIRLNAGDNPYAGNYNNNDNSFYSTPNNVYGFKARGYVYVDGSAVFRLKLPYGDSILYNVKGDIYTTPQSFSGTLVHQYNGLNTKLYLDTAQKITQNNDTFKCKLNLVNPIGDTLTAFKFSLLKCK